MMTSLSNEKELIEFVEKASKCFAENPTYSTYTSGEIKDEAYKGGYLAIRWGLGEDCVLVVKMEEYQTVRIYQQCIRKEDHA